MHRKKYIATDSDANPGQLAVKVTGALSPERIKVEEAMRQHCLSQCKEIKLITEKYESLMKIFGKMHISVTTNPSVTSPLNRKVDGLNILAQMVNRAKNIDILAEVKKEIQNA